MTQYNYQTTICVWTTTESKARVTTTQGTGNLEENNNGKTEQKSDGKGIITQERSFHIAIS